MANYVFIESRGSFESNDNQFIAETATALKKRGHEVTVFLAQNGVLEARKNSQNSFLTRLAEAGVKLLADDFSLRERGVTAAELNSDIHTSSIDALVEILIEKDAKAIWH
jgi:predicted peroxiredoxin